MSSEEASQNPAAVESLSAVADAATLLSSKEVLSSEEPSQNPAAAVESGEKQVTKKELAKLERKHKSQEAAAPTLSAVAADDPLAANYGEIPVEELQSKEVTGRKWTEVKKLTVELEGTAVLIRGHAQAIRAVGKKMAFVVVRRSGFSVQCVLTVAPDLVSPQMVKFATALSKESIVDVEGVVALPSQPITGAVTQQQSPQLHKQMSICGDFNRVFEIGPVFRAEDSDTPSHLCEFTGLDVEMEIYEHYSEVMDIIDRLFVKIFDSLKVNCEKELEAINKQYPFQKLKYLPKTLRLTFEEGVQMLKEAGIEVDPFGDLNKKMERKLGHLVLEKYNTEFYILHRYPLAVRPFYTMPCYDNPKYGNAFDVFIRGEEIISGSQRVHVPEFLTKRVRACGIEVGTMSEYIASFRYGTLPHGGFGMGLERVVMLYCALKNIRKTSLYPRDVDRLAP